MRIIAGEHRGRTLEGPPGDATRPITDRAKQSLFDVLSPQIEGARVADLFAGTGSMGLECLSRGAEEVLFFEADRSALAALRRNIATLRVGDRSKVIAGDLFRLAPPILTPESMDLIFLDPPYRFLVEQPQKLIRLAEVLGVALRPGGVVVFRHDRADRLPLASLHTARTLTYGSMAIEIMTREATLGAKAEKAPGNEAPPAGAGGGR